MENTTPSRYPSRKTEDKKALYQIIDEGLFCTIAFIRDGIAHQIPTGFARVDDHIYIHASSKSRFIESLLDQKVSFSITHMDAFILAPTAFDHSFNYRSVIGFSDVEEIVDKDEKRKFFNLFTDRYIPGRIADIGEPSDDEVSVTKIARLSLNNSAAKVRTGDVNVKMEKDAPWAGVIPIYRSLGEPEMDNQLNSRETPVYIKNLIDGSRKHTDN